ncbi:IS21 family transposase, partial [Rossellomorea vietnamensis]|nr:IS21 family transposase [Rossellomorea vietnamensis]
NIRLTPDGEIIATHTLAEGKGQLILNKNHKRKRSTKLAEWEVEIRKNFDNQDQINEFLRALRDRYPRHMGDQLTILWNLIQHEGNLINQALNVVMDYKLTSANDFRDIVYSLKIEARSNPAPTQEQESPYSHINASTRKIESYIEILKGGHSA